MGARKLVTLTPELLRQVERHREARGLGSTSEAMRDLIGSALSARDQRHAFTAGAKAALREAADYLACRGDCAHRADDIRNLRVPEPRSA